MPWNEVTKVSLRKEFVELALKDVLDFTELCRRYNISRKTGYKWLNRYIKDGDEGLKDESRRPKHSPFVTQKEIEQLILDVKKDHPIWGGRKIKEKLENKGHKNIPSASTITEILKRNDKINPEESLKHKPWVRFEAGKPNDLWQMDFKGWFSIKNAQCHPLTVLDDHSRYSLGIEACINEKGETVKQRLIKIFKKYGMPNAILCDNGSPFGAGNPEFYSELSVWLIRMGVNVIHGRPYHPQTQGKIERFHKTLKAEVIQFLKCDDIDIYACQKEFDNWKTIYNFERPHESLEMKVPGDKYSASTISFPEYLPPIEYAPNDIVRKVCKKGIISFNNNRIRISKAFKGEYVALRNTNEDGIIHVYYCNQRIAKIDMNSYSKI